MKFILTFVTVAFFSSLGLANITADNEYVLNHASTAAQKAQLGTLINRTKNLLIAKYSYAVQGGSTAADIRLLTSLTDPKSYATLPNKAIVTNVWLDSLTQPLTLGGTTSTTIALKIVSAADLFAAGASTTTYRVGFTQGVPTGATTTFIKLSLGASTVKATVANAPLTAGKFNVYIEYVLGD